MNEVLRPGQAAPRAGTYEIVDADGDRTGIVRRGLKGKPLPPTPRKGQGYVYVGRRVRRGR